MGFEVATTGLESSFVTVALRTGGSTSLTMCVIGVTCSGVAGGSGDSLTVGGVTTGAAVAVAMPVCVVEKQVSLLEDLQPP